MSFDLVRGDGPLLLSFPHSGTELPTEIATRLSDAGRALVDTDWYVDELYSFARDLDATALRANLSRYVADCNRDPSGASLYPGRRTTGVCPIETFEGVALYAPGDEPDTHEIAERVRTYWQPYHAALERELARIVTRYGYALLIDGHSIWGHLPLLFEGELPDINVGTNSGASCATEFGERVATSATRAGYSVVVNGRFKGGYITRHYGTPAAGVHALQIEMNQRIYLAEGPRKKLDPEKASRLSAMLKSTCRAILDVAPHTL